MDEKETKKDPRDEADSFWDISALMPRSRRASPAPREITEPRDISAEVPDAVKKTDNTAGETAGEVRIPARGSAPHTAGRRWVPPHSAGDVMTEKAEYGYAPQGSLIHSVEILRWHTGYSYYEQFLRGARALENRTAPECRRVQFFSYMPQYTQLDGAQLAFYLWWRDEVRGGRAPAADYSYILLYIYELINLYSGTPLAEHACAQLCFLWASYRSEYPRLDVQLSEWVCDICLINRLSPPFALLEKIDGAPYLASASLREFYIDCSAPGGREAALVSYCSNYDWRRSRYASGEFAPLYRRHLGAAAARGVGAVTAAGSGAPAMQDTHAVRDAFVGALCTPGVKKRIRIAYCSFSRSHELRFLITDILKYSENRLRAALGIKSRLSYGPIPTAAREAVDAYFAVEFPPAARRATAKKPEAVPEYEKYYEPAPENNTFSLENAAKIELESWQTTDRLIEAFAEDETTPELTEPAVAPAHIQPEAPSAVSAAPDFSGEPDDSLAAALAGYRDFVIAALGGDAAGQKRAAAARGMLTDAMADAINDIAAEMWGDIILEDGGGYYRVIDDYADDVRSAVGS